MSIATILTIEDVALHFDLHQSLGGRKDVLLTTARSGWEFVVSATHTPPDLMLLDHWMPDMLGDEVLDRLRRHPTLKTVPVVLLALGIDPEARDRCLGLGPILVLAVRPTQHELLDEISRLLSVRIRQRKRLPFRVPVRIKTKDGETPGWTRDISALGASIEAQTQIAAGDEIHITFFHPDPPDSGLVGSSKAVVHHVSELADGTLIGVEFYDRTHNLRDFLTKRMREGLYLADVLGQVDRLPGLPDVTARILEEVLKDDADLDRIVPLLRSDPSLTTYLLKLANSASYSFQAPVPTVERAATLMGLKSTRNAVLGYAIFQQLCRDCRDKVAQQLWRHSVACALACELLAPRYGVPPEEAFTLGLLHDAGKFLLLPHLSREEACKSFEGLHRDHILGMEQDLFGMDHAQIGTAILSRWKVPESIHQAVARHHASGVLPDQDLKKPTTELIRAGDALSYLCHLGMDHGVNDGRDALDAQVQPHEREGLCREVFQRLTEVSALFDKSLEPAALCAEIVQRAQETLRQEMTHAEERQALLRRAYERTRQHLVSLVQGEKYHALARIARGVAHEINNPLGYSISNLHTLKDYTQTLSQHFHKQPGAKQPPEIKTILADLPMLIHEVEDGLLRVSSVVQSLQHLLPDGTEGLTMANLQECLQEALLLVKPSKPGEVEVCVGPGRVREVPLSFSGMVRVFVEIVLNAFAAMPSGGRLEIDAREEGEYVLMLFRDTGEGISEEDISHVFEPFFTTRPVGAGRGLGLSIAYGIVSNLRGRLVLSSTPGKGTVVEVRLPLQTRPGAG